LAPFYETRYEKLADWNLDLLEWVQVSLKIKSEVAALETRPEIEAEYINGLRPSNFQDPEFVRGLPVYGQVFQDRIGFQPNMSIMDLLFNEGNNSRSLIAKAFI
jgi:hypothetical protein